MQSLRKIEYWLYACCFMIFVMAVIGAITRLTESGLSITEWKPVTGALPPLSETEWQRQFALYQQSPEFLHKHNWMELADFKRIFFWEWLHRLWGRLIGIVYALPLLWFWIRKQIPQGYGWKLFGLLLLGGSQGVLGWWMVQSGLIDRPNVSHFRLAAHLGLALLIYSLILWVALDLRGNRKPAQGRFLHLHGWCALGMLAATIVWGAFVAGLDAGLVYNTFPLMNGNITPDGAINILSDHGWVQFTHRCLAMAAGLILLALAWRTQSKMLALAVFIQIGLGIATLLSQVSLPIAALHQAGAIILLSLSISVVHGKCIKAG